MSRFLDPTGQPTYGLGLCGRCSRKMFLSELMSDPNSPGLMVCRDDLDQYDPYRLAPRAPDPVVLPFNRPDVSVATNPSGIITQDGTEFIISEDGQRFLFIID